MEIYRGSQEPMTPSASPPESPRRGRAVLLGTALAGALVIGGGAYALADPTPSPGTGQGSGQGAGQGQGQGNGQGQGGRQGMGPRQDQGRPLHGEMVVDQDGSYVTMRLQTGEVTAKTDTSITLKSADGYQQTYAITSGTRLGGGPGMGMGHGRGHGRMGAPGQGQGQQQGTAQPASPAQPAHTLADITVGDTVHVMATVKDGKATAVTLGNEAWRAQHDGEHAPGRPAAGSSSTPGSSSTTGSGSAPAATSGTQG